MKEFPIVHISDDAVFVQTIRGIEPARKMNLECNNAKVGDYAICASNTRRLLMFDYTTNEAKV